MTRLLIKVATEFNLGLQTIVDHLQKKGFEIDPRPTAKVSDEMYAELLKEFQGSIKRKSKLRSSRSLLHQLKKNRPLSLILIFSVIRFPKNQWQSQRQSQNRKS